MSHGLSGVWVGLADGDRVLQHVVEVVVEHGVGKLAEEELDDGRDAVDVLHDPLLGGQVRRGRSGVIVDPEISKKNALYYSLFAKKCALSFFIAWFVAFSHVIFVLGVFPSFFRRIIWFQPFLQLRAWRQVIRGKFGKERGLRNCRICLWRRRKLVRNANEKRRKKTKIFARDHTDCGFKNRVAHKDMVKKL